ncbi:type II toxin-antitoxin system prevent-host-death family antitoxin [Gordonia sp. LSe1-13]|uniref:Antitoxin n=1 Tax=Gordonia sesuvii TaxID=3116777 RepID=A0ABU7MG20_9ACTN|nr:type II toxin-antitoxin system prevent-host-death family antitoxin [Gordonia sp. LSe1-13]
MTTIGLRELRRHASRYLARVEAGEELTVTNRGRAVARIVPVSEAERSREALIDAGVLVPARRPGLLEAIAPERLPQRDLTTVLDEIRAER